MPPQKTPTDRSEFDVLVVSGCFPPAWSWGGQPRSIWNMCRGLARAGARVRVVTTNADLEGRVDVPRRRVEAGIEITTLPVVGGRGAARYCLAPGLIRQVWSAIEDASLCVLQGVWTFPLVVGPRLCRIRGLPYVIVPRGTLESISLSEKPFKKRLYRSLFEASNLRHAAALQFASESERRNSREAIGSVPTIVHPNTIELQARMSRGGAEMRERIGLDPHAVLVGISGRLHPRKGFEIIVPALARCPSRIHLVAFGADESGYANEIERIARDSGVADRVHLLGQLDGEALQSAYASVDLLVMPSYGESFGNTAIEALAQGTEVLVSDRVPLGAWLESASLGTVVRQLDAAQWGEALAVWLERRQDFDRARASRVVRDRYDLKSSGSLLLEDYKRIAS